MTLKKGDSNHTIRDYFTIAGVSVDLTGATVRFSMRNAAGPVTLEPATVDDESGGQVSYRLSASDTATAGNHEYEWLVTFQNGEVGNFPASGPRALRIIDSLV